MKTEPKPPQARERRHPWLPCLYGLAFVMAAGLLVFRGLRQNPAAESDVSLSSQAENSNARRAAPRRLSEGHPSTELEATDDEGLTEKERLVSQILGSGRPVDEIADELLMLLPECSGPIKSLVVSHLTHLVDQDQVGRLLRLLDEPKLNPAAKEEIFSSIYQRDPGDAAALMIQVVEQGSSKYADEAAKALVVLLGVDHGNNAAAWRTELQSRRNLQTGE